MSEGPNESALAGRTHAAHWHGARQVRTRDRDQQAAV